MSGEEHETGYGDQELIEELEQSCPNPINNDINVVEPKPKKKTDKTSSGVRHPRQKFCPRWQLEFPWLRPNPVDDSVGYCSICNKELVCKKSHLERHQRSFKHMRLQGFENVYTVNEPEAELIEAHTSGYLDNDNEQDYQVEEILEDLDKEYTSIKIEPSTTASISTPNIVKKKFDAKATPKKRIIRENEHRQPSLQPSFEKYGHNSHFRGMDPQNYFYSTPPMPSAPKKDTFDLFFESISATVKHLPPKLAAEVKSRVSQVIAEFELRAICEKEAQEKAQQTVMSVPSQVTNVVTVDAAGNAGSSNQSGNSAGVTHYVYAYQPKIQE